jgi:hypothetical protein
VVVRREGGRGLGGRVGAGLGWGGGEDVGREVQEAWDEAALGVVDVDAEGLDLAGFVGGGFEAREMRRVGEAAILVDRVRLLRVMRHQCRGHFGDGVF